MSSKFINAEWYKLKLKLLGTNPEENYIHHYKDCDEEIFEICLDGGDYSDIRKSTFEALKKRNLLKLVAGFTTVQPDTWSYKYTVC